MSRLLNTLRYFTHSGEEFSAGHGVVTGESREWEKAYRDRWAHDKIVRSTHGVNCTGSCSWKIYVKGGIVTWETQQTDYPRTRPDLPNHEPRGCSRGASYSWYLYSGARLKYPLIRSKLLDLWRTACANSAGPVEAWQQIVEDPEKAQSYKEARGTGGFVRCQWDEVNTIIVAANIYTIKAYGPDRIAGFSPIPAMSMVSYAAGSRYLSLIGGVCMSFYDWYCDLPPSSPQTWGEQTDVPESADWYNSDFLIIWGSNVPQTRTPDAHFYTEARYKGTKSVVICPDYSEASKFADLWLAPRAGTDSALAMALGHVVFKEFHLQGKSDYFRDYVKRYSDMPFLVKIDKRDDGQLVPGRFLRAADFADQLGTANNAEWKPVAFDQGNADALVAPHGTAGFRWGEEGRWNLRSVAEPGGGEVDLRLSLLEVPDAQLPVAFPYFDGEDGTVHERVMPLKTITTKDGPTLVATVYDLLAANYGIDRGLEKDATASTVATSYDDDAPYTPAWQEKITGVSRDSVITLAREFANNADKTQGRSMVILGAGLNHWFHMDMIYRGIINLLVMCGCVGKSGGGWAHYVGQEKLRPQTGWLPLAFALDWQRPPRHMNSTSFWYMHTDQWRYEKLAAQQLFSPLATKPNDTGALIDFNVRAERMGWLPSAPQFEDNPLTIAKQAHEAGMETPAYVAAQLKNKTMRMASEDPDNPKNFPRNLFVWRSNLLGSSGKGHEYFIRHLLGGRDGLLQEEGTPVVPVEVQHRDPAPRGKLDLLTTIDFRMSTTCLYSDIVLPTATWYEKNDLNTSDMHPFIHPLSAAVDPVWESRSDWTIFKSFATKFSELCPGILGEEEDTVAIPLLHDTPAELGQPLEVADWKRGECEPVPGQTMPAIKVVKRNYPATAARFAAVGPLLEQVGNGGKGVAWDTAAEVKALAELNGTTAGGSPKIESDIDAAEMILMLAPETNGQVAVKAWEALSKITGQDHRHLAEARADDKIRFRDLQAQPRKIISSPTWSGVESENVSYNAGYTNVHEYIPWRTLTGRQQLYQDHPWMREFGESLCVFKPAIDTCTIADRSPASAGIGRSAAGDALILNFITPHQKWGIHSTYTDNLLMLTMSRGGPIVWISEEDAARAGIEDNDWVEAYNANGALNARAVVSQRIPAGICLMYHAQEKIINVPLSELTGVRGGIHNSVTRIVVKPTHMIGGYVQQSYGFNYYGTVGSNRDEFVIVRKMQEVKWGDEDIQSTVSATNRS